MKFNEIVLHNLGVYQGRQAIDLSSTQPEKPVLLFGGLNGGGKTTFLEAIQLVLYGKLARISRRGSRAYDDFLLDIMNNTVPREEGAAIQLTFTESEGGDTHEYSVIRTWRVKGKRVAELLEVYVDGAFSPSLSENWDEEVERFLPQRLCNLFFFDGEQIEALAEPSQTTNILKTAISSLLGLELVDQLQSDLTAVERKKKREHADKSSSKEIDQLEDQRAAAYQRLDVLGADVTGEKSKLQHARSERAKIEENFENQGGTLYEKSQSLEKERARIKAEIKAKEERLREVAAGALPLALVGKQVEKLHEKAWTDSEAVKAGDALDLVRESHEDAISSLRSEDLPKNVLERVEKILEEKQGELARRASENDSGLGLGDRIFQQISRLLGEDGITGDAQVAYQVLRELGKLEDQLVEIDRELARVPDEGVLHDLMEKRARLRAEEAAQQEKYDAAKQEYEKCSEQLDDLDAQLAKLYESIALRNHEAKLEDRVLSTSARIKDAMTEFKQLVLEKHVTRLETLILESYQSLLRKQGLIRGVEIDPQTLTLSLRGSHGEVVAPKHLSAGERQLLATSILWGLAKASGRALPIVIDTPLGRLDSTHRANLVENYFPNASHQVILLSTDEEIDGRYLKKLEPYLAASYELSFDDESGGTRVVEGYFKEVAA